SERLAEAPTVSARVAIVEQVLRGLSWTSDPLSERALAWLDEMPVAEVAQAPSLQRRSLRRSPQTLAYRLVSARLRANVGFVQSSMRLAGHARRMTTQPDIFTNVHKGLRRALFEVSVALGRADG